MLSYRYVTVTVTVMRVHLWILLANVVGSSSEKPDVSREVS